MPRSTLSACPPNRRPARPSRRRRMGAVLAAFACTAAMAACGTKGDSPGAKRGDPAVSQKDLGGLADEAARLTNAATSLTAHAVILEDDGDGKPAVLTVDASLTFDTFTAYDVRVTDTEGADGELIAVGDGVYARGNSAFWKRFTNEAITADLPVPVASGGYAKVPYKQILVQDLLRLLDPAPLLKTPGITWKPSRESDGTRHLAYTNPLGRVEFVFPADGEAFPRRMLHQDWPRSTTVDYSSFNAPAAIAPPPSAETTDLMDSSIWQKANYFVF